jgi:hypothetical protein
MLPLPLQFLAAWLAVWLGRVLQQEVDYLLAENRVLRERLGNKKLRLTVAERRRLAVLGEQMGRKALAKVATIATPKTTATGNESESERICGAIRAFDQERVPGADSAAGRGTSATCHLRVHGALPSREEPSRAGERFDRR